MNKVVAGALALFGFILGIAISTVIWNVTHEGGEFSLRVEGNFGAVVTVTTTGEPASDKRDVRFLMSGSGREITKDQQVLMRATKFTASGYEWSQVADLPTIVSGVANSKSVGKLADVVVGKKEGSRLAIIQPTDGHVSITIVDILPTRIAGTQQTQITDPLIPQITSNDDGVPVPSAISGEIGNVKVAPIIVGKGAQITDGDIVYANYVLAKADGSVIESTFTNGNPPAYIAVEDVFPGLHAGLVDQRVGSRVVIVVPSAQAQGEGDVIIVVDILAVADKKPGAKSTNV